MCRSLANRQKIIVAVWLKEESKIKGIDRNVGYIDESSIAWIVSSLLYKITRGMRKLIDTYLSCVPVLMVIVLICQVK